MKAWLAMGLLVLPLLVLPGAIGQAPACADVSETIIGVATGGPEETGTGTVDAIEHDLAIGQAGCNVLSLTAELSSSSTTPNTDFDLAVYFGGILLGTSGSPTSDESVSLEHVPWGTYTFEVQPWLTVEAPYELVVTADLEPATAIDGANADDPFVVIAIVDTGINPYHDAWSQETYPDQDVDLTQDPATYLEDYPSGAVRLDLSLDAPTYGQAVAQDDWDAVDQGTLYWVPGTKIVGAISVGSGFVGDTHLLDDDGHGTASAGVAVANDVGACPRCLLVAVEGTAGLTWALSQPWIDLVSNSWGTIANVGAPAGPLGLGPDGFGLPDHVAAQQTRGAVARGQSVLFAAGNGLANAFATPQNTYTSAFTGPDWVLTVGAITRNANADNPNCNCPEDESAILGSGKPVDVSSWALGDIPSVPHRSISGGDQHGGTSAATPIVAGVMGDALLHARTLLGDTAGTNRDGVVATGTPRPSGPLTDGILTRAELEDVVKYTAEHTHSQWIGIYPTSIPTFFAPSAALPAQWAMEGWGVVAPRTGDLAKAVLTGSQPMPSRTVDEAFAALDSANRQVIWGPSPESPVSGIPQA